MGLTASPLPFKHRIPIALRMFLTVLMVTFIISTLSLTVINWSIRQNFSRYVTQLEMQKLEHLNNNLAEIYQVYGSWQTAIDSHIEELPPRFRTGAKLNNNQNRLKQLWLNRQYDIAQQQNEIIKNPKLFQAYMRANVHQQRLFVPSHFQPFQMPPIAPPDQDDDDNDDSTEQTVDKASDNNKNAERSRHWFMQLPDRLGLGHRLALYDMQKNVIAGEQSPDMQLAPIMVDKQPVGYLGLRPAIDTSDVLSVNFFSNQQRYLLLIYASSLLLSLIAAVALAAAFRKPIHQLLRAAQELSHGNYQYHVEVKSNDELGDLSQVINQLAYILDQHEKSRRQWVADTSHELKTPLSVLQAQIEAMQDGVRQATPEHLARMQHQVMSLKKLTQDLADLAQADAAQLTCYISSVNPWNIVQHEVENFKSQFAAKNLQVSITGEDIILETDPDRFRQIIVNLLSNSVRYTLEGGKIAIHTMLTDDEWQLTIDDSPLGMSDEQLAHLGERFYRVDDSRTRSTGGTGLGLALSQQIAQILGGYLQFNHSPLGGLRCTVHLKRHSQESEIV